MDSRYAHPQVTALWSPEWTYAAWWNIELAIIRAQREHHIVNLPDTEAFVSMPVDHLPHFDAPIDNPHLDRIAELEVTTKHDVAAFVQWMREWWGEPHDRWIHYGVTSSDLVDTAQAMRFDKLLPTISAATEELGKLVMDWARDDTPILGRTHGQAAEPTSVSIRARHWLELISVANSQIRSDTRAMRICKVAGPVGTYAHNPPVVEVEVARILDLIPQCGGASQIVPRGSLARWANSAAELAHACAKIAMDLRLMNLVGEASEPLADGQVGSSSMAHKNNPIRAEQITGLQRVAAGYASMLQPLDLWLERDISNSAVERIAVPGLWHVLLHVIKQTTELLRVTEVSTGGAMNNLSLTVHRHSVVRNTNTAIWAGDTVEEAKAWALGKGGEEEILDRDWYTRNYPGFSR